MGGVVNKVGEVTKILRREVPLQNFLSKMKLYKLRHTSMYLCALSRENTCTANPFLATHFRYMCISLDSTPLKIGSLWPGIKATCTYVLKILLIGCYYYIPICTPCTAPRYMHVQCILRFVGLLTGVKSMGK